MGAQIMDAPPVTPNAANETAAPSYGVAFNIEFTNILAFTSLQSPLAAVLKADMDRPLAEAGLVVPPMPDPLNPGKMKNQSVVAARLNWISGLFLVTDWHLALSIMETELRRTGLLSHAETGWRDNDEGTWRRYLPKPVGATFTPLLLSAFEAQPLTPKLNDAVCLFLKAFSLANLAETFLANAGKTVPPPSDADQKL
jgi:hypothetical protein